ncbi:CU044_5270 family protein [Crossiella sp. NPDC003009]
MTEHRVWREDELDAALAALHPEVSPDPEALAAARARLLTAAETPAVRPRLAARRWLVAAAAVAVVTTGALLAQTFTTGGATADARDVLATAAKGADGDRPLRPGEYRYVVARSWDSASTVHADKTYSYLEETLRETWIPFDENAEWVRRERLTGNRQWTLGVTEAEYRAAGLPLDPVGQPVDKRAPRGEFDAAGELSACGQPPCPVTPPEVVRERERKGSWQTPTQAWQDALPADPAALYERLRAGLRPELAESGAFENARAALRTGRLRTEVRNRLYQALRLLPGITVKDGAVDLGGRHGVSLGLAGELSSTEIIIEPASGRFLGERAVVRQDSEHFPRGTIISHSTVGTAVAAQAGIAPSR